MTILAQIAVTPSAADSYPGIDGFLGTRGSLMLDVVFVALFALLPLLGWSIYLVKYRQRYDLHKRLQLVMGVVLLVTVAAFEVDIRLHDWTQRAEPSPYFAAAQKWSCPAGVSLLVHLCFSVPTFFLWIYVLVQALRKFSRPPLPGPHSRSHIFWGQAASYGTLLTALTGWVFYWLAFIA